MTNRPPVTSSSAAVPATGAILKRAIPSGFLIAWLAVLCATFTQAESVSFTFNLPSASTTSAGVYKSDGTLLRTLWNNEPRPAGANQGVWDGFDDNGQVLPSATYQVKILFHNASNVWEGYIGNTSTNQTGSSTFRAFGHICDMAITSTSIFSALGYNEGGGLWNRTLLSDPNAVTTWGLIDFSRMFMFAATDGQVVYFASLGDSYIPVLPSFITAVNAGDGLAYNFSSGITAPRMGTQGVLWNAIDYQESAANFPSGLAVQKNGPYLFVAHSGLNLIHVFNKTTGAAVGSFAVSAPGRIATTVDGHLWIICTENGLRVVRRYNIDGSGSATATTAVVNGLVDPLAIAVSPDNNTLTVVDGDTSQQVKAFNNTASGTPSPTWTLGLAGGYNAVNGPDVTNTKFCFGSKTFLSFQPDGSFWLGDSGNERYLHFSPARAYLGQLAYISANYVATVCDAAPTRLFAKSWLEFAVDYTQPASTGWTLVKNWRAGLPSNYFSNSRPGLQTVVKLNNNRFYAVVPDAASGGSRVVLELPSSGIARETGVGFTDKVLHEDGVLRWQTLGTNSVTYSMQALSGFDASGNPQWSSASTIAAAPKSAIDPAGNGYVGPAGRRFPITSGNLLISANTSGATWNYHLGAVKVGGADWLWKAAPTGVYYDNHGTIGDSTYPANSHYAKGHNIIFCSHGEGYLGSQANQFLHYWDNGLLVGEFGSNLNGGSIPSNTYVAGRTGNALSSSLTQVGDALYLWANDEWGTGMHRWKVGNISSITELTPINITLTSSGGSGEGLTGEYFTGSNFETLSAVRTDPKVDFSWTGSPMNGLPVDNFSVRWSGLVQPVYSQSYTFYTQSDAGVRLWVNGQKIIDNWTAHSSVENTSASVSLMGGQLYKIVMEYYDTTGSAVAQLKWSCVSQAKQVIPMQQLYASNAQAINCGSTALGHFLTDPMGTTTGILSTTSPIDLSGVIDPAPMAAYQIQRRFISGYTFRNLKPFTNYKMRLHVAEIVSANFAVGKRVMPVRINNLDYIVPPIDPFALAGAGYKAAVREVVATTDNAGILDVDFTSTSMSSVAAIEVERDRSSALTEPAFAIVGKGSGLKGNYYTGTNFNTLVASRFDKEVNFTWGASSPVPGVGPSNYTVRWTGRILSYKPGDYTFTVSATQGARLWVNNQLVIDSWTVTGSHSGIITLNAAAFYDIKLEYINTTGSSSVALKWKRPADSITSVIPQFQLYPPPETVLTGYTFTAGSLSPVSVEGHFVASNISRGSALTTPASFATDWVYATGDKTSSSETAALTGSYFTATLTPNAGTTYSLSSLTFDAAFYESTGASNTSYTTNYFVRSSIDNYATTIGSVLAEPGQTSTSPAFHGKTVTLGTSAYTGLTGPVTFRIYIYDNITGSTRLSAIDNLTLSGSATP